MKKEMILSVLQESSFFANMAAADIERVASLCRQVSYEPGSFVFRQGDCGEHLYTIVEGQVHLERSVNLGHRHGHVLIDTLGKGRTLGCWSALLGESHILMSSATVEKPTVVLAFSGPDLRLMMTENAAFGFKMMERLCFLLRERIQAAYGAMDRF
jgi:CRP-like cAMP-binding protein